MTQSLSSRFQELLPDTAPTDPAWTTDAVSALLNAARIQQATDIHLVPDVDGLRMSWRIDGVLQPVYNFPRAQAPRMVARLKVLAHLLTYRTDTPQEGRIIDDADGNETRISTFPTLYGEKAVVRLFAAGGRFERVAQLGLPTEIQSELERLITATGGVILLTGPAGSGKTTTIYACLREIVDKSRGQRSLSSLEDPIEIVVPGVAQSQVNTLGGFDLATGLRSMMRQDPEVIMVGEIRDQATAEAVFQAALTGHLILTTFHAGGATGAISRLSDMGIEPYLLRSCVAGILCQRLLRRLCDCAVEWDVAEAAVISTRVPLIGSKRAVGCEKCSGTGYRGRLLIAEMVSPDHSEVGHAILSRSDSGTLDRLAIESGMISQRARAIDAVREGITSVDEIYRVFGPLAFQHS